MVRLILILSLIGQISYADDVIFLNKDDKAPNPGYLFSESKTKEVRIKILERDSFESTNASITKQNLFLTDMSDRKDKQLKEALDRDDVLAKSLRDQQSTTNWERIAWFAGGVLSAIGMAYGIHQASR